MEIKVAVVPPLCINSIHLNIQKMTKNIMDSTQKFYAECGEIILLGTSIEHMLGQHLTRFLLKQDYQELYLPENAFADVRFEQKMMLLKKLCEEKQYPKKDKLMETLKKMQNMRNKIAHWGAMYKLENNEFTLKDLRKNSITEINTSAVLKEMQQNWHSAYKELTELHNYLNAKFSSHPALH